MPSNESPITVFKGGTAFNNLLEDFKKLFPKATYIVPITDDGGSSREIRRVFDGPGIGDLRSTLTRLSDDSTPESKAVKKLLEHRLDSANVEKASSEWRAILEEDHPLYESISSKYKSLIRGFLCKFEAERLNRITSQFDLRNGSIGNFFFTGARMTLGSLETAIFIYSSIARIPPTTHVVPIIDSRECLNLAAQLENGEVIIGQNGISHPSELHLVHKEVYAHLPAPIEKIVYLDKSANPLHPKPQQDVCPHIKKSGAVIYGIGSLWTSILPSLILQGIGEEIATLKAPKIFLLNCCNDRETEGMSAINYLRHLTDALNRFGELNNTLHDYVTDLFVVEGCVIPIDENKLSTLNIRVHVIPADKNTTLLVQDIAHPSYDSRALIKMLNRLS